MKVTKEDNAICIALSEANLTRIPAAVTCPTYRRSELKPGIVHIGVGNFHRAHQAWYIHQLMQKGLAQDWAIVGAGVRPYDAEMRNRLLEQDCLTTLIELSPQGASAEIIGSMIDYIATEPGNRGLVRQIAKPDIRIVSLTVTESGYFMDPITGGFDAAHPDIQHDISNPDHPRSVFGAIVAALDTRRTNGAGPVTVMSCDNLRGNGMIARQSVVSLARLIKPELAAWIEEKCSFPNSMVDCIVPATGPDELAMAQKHGVDDKAVVTHENYRRWVLEDDFCAGRPVWEKLGVTMTPDVHDYETMKIRILNGGHQILANVGELLSVDTISACMENPLISQFFQKIERDEIAPYVTSVPGMTPAAYVDLIAARFSNPAIRDTTRRVAYDGSSRHPEFILPVLRGALQGSGSINGLALVEALWARMCEGSRQDGSTIQDNDPHWQQLSVVAKESRRNPQAWIEQRSIYGKLATNIRFYKAFTYWLDLIWEQGVERTIETYLGSESSIPAETAK
ncbi:Mannitol 2-dehydrogenase [Phaeobacter sp. CECT 5382]|uniref:mannitol dehydrogenase family protein n=1 Tax=Phaeobacter sp. CECT 5382 TaxID=1712645 RepID=UPI0006D9981D|nr:mannitol dehydrogenase family protein [Phaeobacter sp. CECT 5382]CUH89769.1 Mannitol 2-dehydrogenase [Phaeobacter sp. CECT 5382]